MQNSKYKRILLKLSGESLMGERSFGIDPPMIMHYATEILEVANLGVEVAIVIGGGNIFRGLQAAENGIERVQGDYMGMLATCINGLALQSVMESIGLYTRHVSAMEMREIAEPFIRRKAINHLEKERVVIFSGGTGSPYFTTDSAAALRANQINADILIKATRVDGIYNKDPEKHSDAIKYEQMLFSQVIEQNLKVMDMTAFTLCQENDMPIAVIDVHEKGNLLKFLIGENIGTIVTN